MIGSGHGDGAGGFWKLVGVVITADECTWVLAIRLSYQAARSTGRALAQVRRYILWELGGGDGARTHSGFIAVQ